MFMTISLRTLTAWKIAIAAFLFVNLMGLGLLYNHGGIYVTIQNEGPATIESVVLHVTGNTHSLGDLHPGGSKTAIVKPTSESHLEIEFGRSERRQRLDAGGYFEPGDSGTIHITIKDGVIERNDQQISMN